MYNGIGLATPRGSGTNGHVQRNFALLRKREKIKAVDDSKNNDANRVPNQEILEHAKKRKIELKCIELTDTLEEQGYTEEEIQEKVAAYRAILQREEEKIVPKIGGEVVQETHHIAAANLAKNAQLRDAFNISEYFVEGTSFDPERREREAQLKAALEKKKYEWVRTPSPSELGSKDKKEDKKEASDEEEDSDSEKSKKKKSKKAKKSSKSKKRRRRRSSSEEDIKEKRKK